MEKVEYERNLTLLKQELQERQNRNKQKKKESKKLKKCYHKILAPYLIAGSLIVSGCSFLVQFREKNNTERYIVEDTIDSLGKTNHREYFDKRPFPVSIVYVYEPWHFNVIEKQYEQVVSTYILDSKLDINPEDLLKPDVCFSDIFKKPLDQSTRKSVYLPEEELSRKDGYVKLVLVSENKEKTIPYNVSLKDYVDCIIPELILFFVISRLIYDFQNRLFQEYNSILKSLNLEDTKELQEEIKLQKKKH